MLGLKKRSAHWKRKGQRAIHGFPSGTHLALTILEDRTVPVTNILNSYPGFNQTDTSFVVPDIQFAVGPTHLVEAVNSNLVFIDKSNGSKSNSQTLRTFFPGVASANTVFDPKITYDELAQRFFLVALETDTNPQSPTYRSDSHLLLAVSNTNNPTDGFTEKHRINIQQFSGSVSLWGDNDRIGYNADVFAVTVNMYNKAGQGDHGRILIYNKPSLVDKNTSTITPLSSTDRTQFSIAPARMHGAVPNGPMYFVSNNTTSTVIVTTGTNVVSVSPAFTNQSIAVANYSVVPDAPQLGGSNLKVSLTGDRMADVAWRNNRLVATHVVGSGTGTIIARARWYEFNTVSTPAKTQEAEINTGASKYTYDPSIDINQSGDIAIGFHESASNEYLSMYVTGQMAGAAANSWQTPVLIKAGTGTLVDPNFRVGDYSSTFVDPSDNDSFWAGNEYAQGTIWGSQVAKVKVGIANANQKIYAAAAQGIVKLYDGGTNANIHTYPAFAGWAGEVRVAIADINNDSTPDIIAAAGVGGGPRVTAISGANGMVLGDFFAYGITFTGGVFVAAGDVNGDSKADIITGAGAGGGPSLRIFDGSKLPSVSVLTEFYAYDSKFTGGITVAAGDVNADGKSDVITGKGPGDTTRVHVYLAGNPANLAHDFDAIPGFVGGIYVSAGDVSGDGKAEVVVGAGAGGGPSVGIFNLVDGTSFFYAYDPTFSGGVRVGVRDLNGDGKAEIITGAGSGGGPHLRIFKGETAFTTHEVRYEFFAFDPGVTVGIFVA
jgi:hypothetical protein